MEKRGVINSQGLFICLSLLLLVSIFVAVSMGSVPIEIQKVVKLVGLGVLGKENLVPDDHKLADIIWLLRLPRVILAICVGAGLAVCGVVMQAIVKNPLADPYILGVSSGASLGATAAILIGVGTVFGENFVGVVAALGALLVSLLVLFLANCGGRANSMKLLLAGMAISAVCTAFSSFIIYIASDKDGMQTISYWLMGSLAGAKWQTLLVMFPLLLGSIGFFYSQSRVLNLMLVGDEVAITLGMDLHRYRQIYLLISALMIGFIVYASGMIGFVGLIIPHVIRMFVGTDHKLLLPFSAVVGAIFLIWADILCRIIIPRAELPIGVLIAFIGAPCFVYLMVKKSYGFGGSD